MLQLKVDVIGNFTKLENESTTDIVNYTGMPINAMYEFFLN